MWLSQSGFRLFDLISRSYSGNSARLLETRRQRRSASPLAIKRWRATKRGHLNRKSHKTFAQKAAEITELKTSVLCDGRNRRKAKIHLYSVFSVAFCEKKERGKAKPGHAPDEGMGPRHFSQIASEL
jgi:hypothetical protein